MFRCPRCQARAVKITGSIRLGPDDWSDDRAVQSVVCGACGFEGVAKMESSSRGSGESVHHEVFPSADAAGVRHAIAECAASEQRNCECPAHQRMRALFEALRGGEPLRFE